ncbi:MAG: hypothetical protein ABGX16_22950 [Pirellulales bacterium]
MLGGTTAILIAALQILPAQYGIDLTGFGTYVGLTKIYNDKENMWQFRNTTDKEERITIQVSAGDELEYKLYLLEGGQIEYSWTVDTLKSDGSGATADGSGSTADGSGSTADGSGSTADGAGSTDLGEIFFEFHGEPEDKHGIHFKRYTLGTSHQESSSFEALFDGTHGWYWKNHNTYPITITLEVQGKFNLVGLKAVAFSR